MSTPGVNPAASNPPPGGGGIGGGGLKRKQGPRWRLSPAALRVLEAAFQRNNFPTVADKDRLAQDLKARCVPNRGLSARDGAGWRGARRAGRGCGGTWHAAGPAGGLARRCARSYVRARRASRGDPTGAPCAQPKAGAGLVPEPTTAAKSEKRHGGG